jgi:hypothetical protein
MAAMDQIMELIYAATADKAHAKGMTDDQHADWMAAIFDRVIRDTAGTNPALAENVLTAVAADLNA